MNSLREEFAVVRAEDGTVSERDNGEDSVGALQKVDVELHKERK